MNAHASFHLATDPGPSALAPDRVAAGRGRPATQARGADGPETSRILSLVSTPYKTADGTLVPHNSDIDAHAAFVASRDAAVQRVISDN